MNSCPTRVFSCFSFQLIDSVFQKFVTFKEPNLFLHSLDMEWYLPYSARVLCHSRSFFQEDGKCPRMQLLEDAVGWRQQDEDGPSWRSTAQADAGLLACQRLYGFMLDRVTCIALSIHCDVQGADGVDGTGRAGPCVRMFN